MIDRLRRRLAPGRLPWFTVAWITLVWATLWGDFSVGTLAAGLVLGLLVPMLLPLPSFGYGGRVRPGAVIRLMSRFVGDLVVASFQVAFLALNPAHVPRGAVIRVQLRTDVDLYMAFIAELACMVPGSVVVEVLPEDRSFYIHILDVDAMGGIEKVRSDVLAVEERLLFAIASTDELTRVGLSARGSR